MSPPRRWCLRDPLLILLVIVLFSGFCALGAWQMQRRSWKLDLISRVERQLGKAPVIAPDRAAWASIGRDQAYLPVKVAGRFLHDKETFVQAMTTHGSGYWLLTPLRSEQGYVVLVNRGFVDPGHRDPASRQSAQAESRVKISGLLRLSEPRGRFLQPNELEVDRWYSRDVAAISSARRLAEDELAPYFIDANGNPNPGGWPVGGLTVVHFRNAHLGYALTWFGLALMTGAAAWLVMREHRSRENRGQTKI